MSCGDSATQYVDKRLHITVRKSAIPGRFPNGFASLAPVLCVVLLAMSVLAFQPGGLYRFVWAKVIILALAVILGLLSVRGGSIPRMVWFAMAAAVTWLLLAAALSDAPGASFMGRWPRYEGFPVLALYVGLFVVGARVLAGRDAKSRWSLLRLCLSLAALVLFELSVLEAAGMRPLGGALDSRPGATLGNASDQGLVAVLMCGLLLAPAGTESSARTWIVRGGRVASALVVLLSGSRAALAGLVVLLIFSLIWRLRDAKGTVWPVAGRGIVAVVAFLGVVLVVPGIRDRFLSGETVEGRWLLWQQTVGLLGDHFWFGVGPSGFVDAFPSYLSGEWTREVGNDFPADSPHMWVLQAAVAGGILFLALVVLACSRGVVLAVRRIKSLDDPGLQRDLQYALLAGAACAAGLLTHFTSPGTTGLLAFVAGGVLGLPSAVQSMPRTPGKRSGFSPRVGGTRIGPVGLFVLILAVAIPAAAAEWPMKAGVDQAGEGLMEEANASFEAASVLRPWDGDTALLAAQAFAGPAADGDPAAASFAIQWARKSLDRTPTSPEAGLILAIGQLNSGEIAEAKTRLDGLIIQAPYDEKPYIQRGIANFGLGNTDASIIDLNKAAELAPDSATPWSILARIYTRTGDTNAAAHAQSRAEALQR